jgi:hypothetical protein
VDGTQVRHAAKLYRPALENRAYLELARLLADPVLRGHGVPGGDGRAVLLLPGYLAGDRSLSLLARFLRRIGYLPVFSGIAFNSGCAGSYERRSRRVPGHRAERRRQPTRARPRRLGPAGLRLPHRVVLLLIAGQLPATVPRGPSANLDLHP